MTDRSKHLSTLPSHRDLYYGGQWHAPLAGAYRATYDPAHGITLAEIADADARDVDAAVNAAQEGFKVWRSLKLSDRVGMMRDAAAILRANAVEFATIDSLNTGNPISEMTGDAKFAAASMEYFAGLAGELKGHTMPTSEGQLNYTVREPLGVVARIVAYNHPLMFAAAKIGAPLAAGNSVVLKAADQAPLSALRLAELIGGVFPPGVVNVVTGGIACGQALTTHPVVRKVTLIGGIPTGRAVMQSAAASLKPVILELGGKNALVAYPDADIDALVAGAVRGMNFTWAGQSCGSMSRLFLHADIHDRVLEAVAKRTHEMHKPGVPTDAATTMGPLISEAQFNKVMKYIGLGREQGARLVTGGKRPTDSALAKGWFVEPTIFADVTTDMRIAREEIFGPVLSVLRWDDEETMFKQVNELEYGLTSSIWTRSLATAHRAAARIQAGYIWVNNVSEHFLGAPFGGYKQSGVGREECIEEMFEFSQLKNVNLKF
jgi:betaine-aldehyde dehydrogenase